MTKKCKMSRIRVHIVRTSYPVFELEFGEAAAEYEDLVRFVLALLFEGIPLLCVDLPDGDSMSFNYHTPMMQHVLAPPSALY